MKIENATVNEYQAFLKDHSRPPSKGGNTKAWHVHVMAIGDDKYTFLALGTKQWVFKNDSVSFDWNWDETAKRRYIDKDTIITIDKTGKAIVRGHRGLKPWRTASSRLPASRREWRD